MATQEDISKPLNLPTFPIVLNVYFWGDKVYFWEVRFTLGDIRSTLRASRRLSVFGIYFFGCWVGFWDSVGQGGTVKVSKRGKLDSQPKPCKNEFSESNSQSRSQNWWETAEDWECSSDP